MGCSLTLVFTLFYIFLLRDNTLLWIGWLVFILGILLGIPFTYLSIKYKPCACIASALPAGICIALILQVAAVYMIDLAYAIYMSLGAFCLITVVASLYF
jgi:hypothetical protein